MNIFKRIITGIRGILAGRIDYINGSDTLPPPLTLPAGKAFQVPYRARRPAPPAPAALLPASLARSGVEGLAEAAEKARPRDAELLDLPDSLKEK